MTSPSDVSDADVSPSRKRPDLDRGHDPSRDEAIDDIADVDEGPLEDAAANSHLHPLCRWLGWTEVPAQIYREALEGFKYRVGPGMLLVNALLKVGLVKGLIGMAAALDAKLCSLPVAGFFYQLLVNVGLAVAFWCYFACLMVVYLFGGRLFQALPKAWRDGMKRDGQDAFDVWVEIDAQLAGVVIRALEKHPFLCDTFTELVDDVLHLVFGVYCGKVHPNGPSRYSELTTRSRFGGKT